MKGATAIASNNKWAKILCIAGFEGDLKKLKLLHKCEVNLEISDYDLRNIAHLAACEGHVNILEYLVTQTNFNLELKDRWGTTAFDEMKTCFSRPDANMIKELYAKRSQI